MRERQATRAKKDRSREGWHFHLKTEGKVHLAFNNKINKREVEGKSLDGKEKAENKNERCLGCFSSPLL